MTKTFLLLGLLFFSATMSQAEARLLQELGIGSSVLADPATECFQRSQLALPASGGGFPLFSESFESDSYGPAQAVRQYDGTTIAPTSSEYQAVLPHSSLWLLSLCPLSAVNSPQEGYAILQYRSTAIIQYQKLNEEPQLLGNDSGVFIVKMRAGKPASFVSFDPDKLEAQLNQLLPIQGTNAVMYKVKSDDRSLSFGNYLLKQYLAPRNGQAIAWGPALKSIRAQVRQALENAIVTP